MKDTDDDFWHPIEDSEYYRAIQGVCMVALFMGILLGCAGFWDWLWFL